MKGWTPSLKSSSSHRSSAAAAGPGAPAAETPLPGEARRLVGLRDGRLGAPAQPAALHRQLVGVALGAAHAPQLHPGERGLLRHQEVEEAVGGLCRELAAAGEEGGVDRPGAGIAHPMLPQAPAQLAHVAHEGAAEAGAAARRRSTPTPVARF